MELPDNLLAELEILENITSCNKVDSQFKVQFQYSRWQQQFKRPASKNSPVFLCHQIALIYQLSDLDQVENYLMLSEYEQNLSKVKIYLGIRGFKPFLTKDFKISLDFDFLSFNAFFYSEWQLKTMINPTK